MRLGLGGLRRRLLCRETLGSQNARKEDRRHLAFGPEVNNNETQSLLSGTVPAGHAPSRDDRPSCLRVSGSSSLGRVSRLHGQGELEAQATTTPTVEPHHAPDPN